MALLGGAVGANILHVPTDVSWSECGRNHLYTVPACRLSPQLLSFTITNGGCVLGFRYSFANRTAYTLYSSMRWNLIGCKSKRFMCGYDQCGSHCQPANEMVMTIKEFLATKKIHTGWKAKEEGSLACLAPWLGDRNFYFCAVPKSATCLENVKLSSDRPGPPVKCQQKRNWGLSVNASAGVRPEDEGPKPQLQSPVLAGDLMQSCSRQISDIRKTSQITATKAPLAQNQKPKKEQPTEKKGKKN